MSRQLIYILVFCLLASSCLAATLSGTVYDDNLDEVQDVIIEVNSTPWQRFVAKDGTYEFNLAPGTYELTAKFSLDSSQTSKDLVTMPESGDFIFDLFLLPGLDEEIELIEDTEETKINGETEDILKEPTPQIGMTAIITAMIILFAILVIAYFYRVKIQRDELKEINKGLRQSKRRAKEHPADDKVKKVLKEMEIKEKIERDEKSTSDTKIILDILKQEGGRATQKEIRKHIPLSEAKISLMIAELEAKGKVKKVKKGRGNIIILN